MTKRGLIPAALIATWLLVLCCGCLSPTSEARSGTDTKPQESLSKAPPAGSNMSMHYLEIVTNNVEELCAAYERVHGLSFGAENADLGQARVAFRSDGSAVGIRMPLAEHEQPITRTYLVVPDILKAVEEAEKAGAVLAYPPTQHGDLGTFAIFIHGDVQHGLWQR